MKYLGLDYGKKFIGLALADSNNRLSMPLEIIRNIDNQESIKKIKEIVENYKIDKIIVGKANWHNNKQNTWIEKFVNDLKKEVKTEYDWVDESLTSQAARSLPNLQIKNDRIDDLSAMLILQSYLDLEQS